MSIMEIREAKEINKVNEVKKDPSQSINEQLISIHGAISSDTAAGIGDSETNYPYVIFQVADSKFAINCKYVLSIEKSVETTELTKGSSEIRGIAYYKNEAINVFDMRQLFGYISQQEYIRTTVDIPQRIQDHIEYENNLKNCFETNTPFRLTTDPHNCKFGQWFYSYKSKANLEIRSQLERVEPVHDKFHFIAEKVKDSIVSGKTDEGQKLLEDIGRAKTEIIPLLNDLNDILLNNIVELMIVLKVNNKKVGIIIDNTESVESIYEIQNLPPAVVLTEYVKKMGLRKKDSEIVLILEATSFS